MTHDASVLNGLARGPLSFSVSGAIYAPRSVNLGNLTHATSATITRTITHSIPRVNAAEELVKNKLQLRIRNREILAFD